MVVRFRFSHQHSPANETNTKYKHGLFTSRATAVKVFALITSLPFMWTWRCGNTLSLYLSRSVSLIHLSHTPGLFLWFSLAYRVIWTTARYRTCFLPLYYRKRKKKMKFHANGAGERLRNNYYRYYVFQTLIFFHTRHPFRIRASLRRNRMDRVEPQTSGLFF